LPARVRVFVDFLVEKLSPSMPEETRANVLA
jgi:hypothetical protein